MDKFRNYDIAFSGLKTGGHDFRFEISDAFFNLFETVQEFSQSEITADIHLEKHTTFLEVSLHISGSVQLICDISSVNFRQEIENELQVLVKFGEAYDDSEVDIITIPHQDHALNMAHLIYECIVLAIPMKKVAPNVDEKILQVLDKYSPKITEDIADPRWDALKKLKDKN